MSFRGPTVVDADLLARALRVVYSPLVLERGRQAQPFVPPPAVRTDRRNGQAPDAPVPDSTGDNVFCCLLRPAKRGVPLAGTPDNKEIVVAAHKYIKYLNAHSHPFRVIFEAFVDSNAEGPYGLSLSSDNRCAPAQLKEAHILGWRMMIVSTLSFEGMLSDPKSDNTILNAVRTYLPPIRGAPVGTINDLVSLEHTQRAAAYLGWTPTMSVNYTLTLGAIDVARPNLCLEAPPTMAEHLPSFWMPHSLLWPTTLMYYASHLKNCKARTDSIKQLLRARHPSKHVMMSFHSLMYRTSPSPGPFIDVVYEAYSGDNIDSRERPRSVDANHAEQEEGSDDDYDDDDDDDEPGVLPDDDYAEHRPSDHTRGGSLSWADFANVIDADDGVPHNNRRTKEVALGNARCDLITADAIDYDFHTATSGASTAPPVQQVGTGHTIEELRTQHELPIDCTDTMQFIDMLRTEINNEIRIVHEASLRRGEVNSIVDLGDDTAREETRFTRDDACNVPEHVEMARVMLTLNGLYSMSIAETLFPSAARAFAKLGMSVPDFQAFKFVAGVDTLTVMHVRLLEQLEHHLDTFVTHGLYPLALAVEWSLGFDLSFHMIMFGAPGVGKSRIIRNTLRYMSAVEATNFSSGSRLSLISRPLFMTVTYTDELSAKFRRAGGRGADTENIAFQDQVKEAMTEHDIERTQNDFRTADDGSGSTNRSMTQKNHILMGLLAATNMLARDVENSVIERVFPDVMTPESRRGRDPLTSCDSMLDENADRWRDVAFAWVRYMAAVRLVVVMMMRAGQLPRDVSILAGEEVCNAALKNDISDRTMLDTPSITLDSVGVTRRHRTNRIDPLMRAMTLMRAIYHALELRCYSARRAAFASQLIEKTCKAIILRAEEARDKAIELASHAHVTRSLEHTSVRRQIAAQFDDMRSAGRVQPISHGNDGGSPDGDDSSMGERREPAEVDHARGVVAQANAFSKEMLSKLTLVNVLYDTDTFKTALKAFEQVGKVLAENDAVIVAQISEACHEANKWIQREEYVSMRNKLLLARHYRTLDEHLKKLRDLLRVLSNELRSARPTPGVTMTRRACDMIRTQFCTAGTLPGAPMTFFEQFEDAAKFSFVKTMLKGCDENVFLILSDTERAVKNVLSSRRQIINIANMIPEFVLQHRDVQRAMPRVRNAADLLSGALQKLANDPAFIEIPHAAAVLRSLNTSEGDLACVDQLDELAKAVLKFVEENPRARNFDDWNVLSALLQDSTPNGVVPVWNIVKHCPLPLKTPNARTSQSEQFDAMLFSIACDWAHEHDEARVEHYVDLMRTTVAQSGAVPHARGITIDTILDIVSLMYTTEQIAYYSLIATSPDSIGAHERRFVSYFVSHPDTKSGKGFGDLENIDVHMSNVISVPAHRERRDEVETVINYLRNMGAEHELSREIRVAISNMLRNKKVNVVVSGQDSVSILEQQRVAAQTTRMIDSYCLSYRQNYGVQLQRCDARTDDDFVKFSDKLYANFGVAQTTAGVTMLQRLAFVGSVFDKLIKVMNREIEVWDLSSASPLFVATASDIRLDARPANRALADQLHQMAAFGDADMDQDSDSANTPLTPLPYVGEIDTTNPNFQANAISQCLNNYLRDIATFVRPGHMQQSTRSVPALQIIEVNDEHETPRTTTGTRPTAAQPETNKRHVRIVLVGQMVSENVPDMYNRVVDNVFNYATPIQRVACGAYQPADVGVSRTITQAEQVPVTPAQVAASMHFMWERETQERCASLRAGVIAASSGWDDVHKRLEDIDAHAEPDAKKFLATIRGANSETLRKQLCRIRADMGKSIRGVPSTIVTFPRHKKLSIANTYASEQSRVECDVSSAMSHMPKDRHLAGTETTHDLPLNKLAVRRHLANEIFAQAFSKHAISAMEVTNEEQAMQKQLLLYSSVRCDRTLASVGFFNEIDDFGDPLEMSFEMPARSAAMPAQVLMPSPQQQQAADAPAQREMELLRSAVLGTRRNSQRDGASAEPAARHPRISFNIPSLSQ